jgi:hypothetical protein
MKGLPNTAQMTNQRDMLGACIAVSVWCEKFRNIRVNIRIRIAENNTKQHE